MEENFKIQVPREHYMNNYDSIERFISYFCQIDFALKTKARRILEIGIGNKTVSDYLKRCGLEVTTCDFDHSLGPDIVADIRKLPFEKNQFETVLAFEILEHIPFSDFEKALAEISRVSSKNVIISIPYSCAHIENLTLICIPFFSKLFRIALRVPYFFMPTKLNEKNKEHYWEMGRKGYSKKRIREVLKKYFKIKKEFQPELNSYHYFFILEKI